MRIYKDFIQRYTDLIGAIQNHERACDGNISSSYIPLIYNYF